MNQNQVFLIGRAAGVPQLKTYTKGDGSEGFRCWFKLAVTRLMDRGAKRDEQRTSFINVVTWGEAAKRHAQYIGKGDAVNVMGELVIDSQKNDDGTYTEFVNVTARDIQYLGKSLKNDSPEGLAKRAAGIQARLTEITAGLAAGSATPAPSDAPAPGHTATDGSNPFTPDGAAPSVETPASE
jgi:single-stranded DNA-binding protein